ncbi:hypothetical protein BH23ACT11_BH23ACT11_06670 [soil metagenome]
MRPYRLPAVIVAVIVVLTLGLVAGCSGGEEQSNNEASGGNTSGAGVAQNEESTARETVQPTARGEEGSRTEEAQGSSPKIKIALGDILRIDSENSLVVLKPPETKRQVFKVVPGAEVTVDDSPAQLADLEKRQQAQIRYVVINDRNRARAVSAFNDGG